MVIFYVCVFLLVLGSGKQLTCAAFIALRWAMCLWYEWDKAEACTEEGDCVNGKAPAAVPHCLGARLVHVLEERGGGGAEQGFAAFAPAL